MIKCENCPYIGTSLSCLIKCHLNSKNKKYVKSIYKIQKVSKKRQIELLRYNVLRIEFLNKKENQICPITGKQATTIHHKMGRIGDLFLNTEFWVALSMEGHEFVEKNPNWAKDNGFSLNRL
jgi:hypothetical protein